MHTLERIYVRQAGDEELPGNYDEHGILEPIWATDIGWRDVDDGNREAVRFFDGRWVNINHLFKMRQGWT